MIGRTWSAGGQSDLATNDDGSLASGDMLLASAYRSLFTRARVDDVDGAALPNVPQGWWADRYLARPIGSRLWTLSRSKLNDETLRLVRVYSEQALAWWVTSRIARSVTAKSERLPGMGTDGIALKITAIKRDGTPWEHVWERHLNGL